MTDFETRIEFLPGYDYRTGAPVVDPNRGAHGMEIRFSLIGPLGAISWKLQTGWMERPLVGHLHPYSGRRDKPGIDGALLEYSPSAGAVSSHVHEQREDYWLGPNECDVIGGECYGDTGYTIGDRVLIALMKDGHAGVWRELEDIYNAWLVPEQSSIQR
jgi:hypothetical protein